MGGQRYSRIVSASRYAKALANYVKYVSGTSDRQTKLGSGKGRPTAKTLFVTPFGVALGSNQYAECSAGETAYNDYKSSLSGYVLESVDGTTKTSIKMNGFRAARVSVKTGFADTGKIETSKVTGMKYLSYGGKSSSVPFGKKASGDIESSVFDTLKKAVSTSTNKISWIREKA